MKQSINVPASNAAVLAEEEYLRQRLNPMPGDVFYLHLSDLRQALELALPPAGVRVLDYGCGGSPYRPLFQTEAYLRADIAGTPAIDFCFDESSRIAAPSGSFDCVLSTQVLEHVRSVDIYLRECRRLLASGGRLVLTTHGTFQDHACPHDFWRWTADGLRLALETFGFRVTSLYKLTTGPRALLHLNEQLQPALLVHERSFTALGLRLGRLLYTRGSRRRRHVLSDREQAGNRVVPAETQGHSLYIAILAVAEPA